MEILVEKYVQWLQRKNDVGDIMPEMRHGKKDQELQKAFENIRLSGTFYVKRDRIRRRLPAKTLKFRKKSDNVIGLQICDLIAHPSYIYVRQTRKHDVHPGPYALRVIGLLRQEKYDRSYWNVISGYGIKYLP